MNGFLAAVGYLSLIFGAVVSVGLVIYFFSYFYRQCKVVEELKKEIYGLERRHTSSSVDLPGQTISSKKTKAKGKKK